MTDYKIAFGDVFTAQFDAPQRGVSMDSNPITCAFTLPRSISAHDVSILVRTSQRGWQPIIAADTKNDYYQIAAATQTLYLSLRATHKKEFVFVDKDGCSMPVKFRAVSRYLNGCKAAVVISADDWSSDDSQHAAFVKAAKACRERDLWLTAGVVTNHMPAAYWQEMSDVFYQGKLELASHSCSHPAKAPYANSLFTELAHSRAQIGQHIPTSQIVCWIEPHGYLDASIARKLAEAGYLVSRSTQKHRKNFCSFTHYGCFLRAGIMLMLEKSSLGSANSAFDRCIKSGGIYHAAMHPLHLNWSEDGWIHKHLDYISQHKDIWYVGLGDLYRYRFTVNHALTLSQNNRILHKPQPHWKRRLAGLMVDIRMFIDRISVCLIHRQHSRHI